MLYEADFNNYFILGKSDIFNEYATSNLLKPPGKSPEFFLNFL